MHTLTKLFTWQMKKDILQIFPFSCSVVIGLVCPNMSLITSKYGRFKISIPLVVHLFQPYGHSCLLSFFHHFHKTVVIFANIHKPITVKALKNALFFLTNWDSYLGKFETHLFLLLENHCSLWNLINVFLYKKWGNTLKYTVPAAYWTAPWDKQ